MSRKKKGKMIDEELPKHIIHFSATQHFQNWINLTYTAFFFLLGFQVLVAKDIKSLKSSPHKINLGIFSFWHDLHVGTLIKIVDCFYVLFHSLAYCVSCLPRLSMVPNIN